MSRNKQGHKINVKRLQVCNRLEIHPNYGMNGLDDLMASPRIRKCEGRQETNRATHDYAIRESKHRFGSLGPADRAATNTGDRATADSAD